MNAIKSAIVLGIISLLLKFSILAASAQSDTTESDEVQLDSTPSDPNQSGDIFPAENPIPGGITIVTIPAPEAEKPIVKFGNKEIIVLRKNNKWVGVVGLSQDILPGKYLLTVLTSNNISSKVHFRIYPLRAGLSQRTITLPENLYALDFRINQSPDTDEENNVGAIDEGQTFPVFTFNQIVNSGHYIPYGRLINESSPTQMINHPWLTYITDIDELVRAPAMAIVERIFLTDQDGITVALNHGFGIKSTINYLNDTILKPGQKLNQGDIIGTPKSVSGSNINRVDWQLTVNGASVDPLQFTPAS